MTPRSRQRHVSSRIVVALNAPKHSLGALEIASVLASRLNADLEALFVEEEELMNVASLPFALEVDRVSGVTRPLDSGVMARVLRTEATLLRRLLARASATLPTSPKLRVVRGRYLAQALSVAASADMTILHRSRRSYDEVRGRSVARATRRRKPLWVVFDGAPDSVRALQITAELARALGSELVVLLHCEKPDEAAAVERQARAQVAEIVAPARFVTVTSVHPEALKRAVGREGADLLVLARATARLEEGSAAQWLEDIGTPVMLVA